MFENYLGHLIVQGQLLADYGQFRARTMLYLVIRPDGSTFGEYLSLNLAKQVIRCHWEETLNIRFN